MQGSLNKYTVRVSVFLILILIIVVFLYPVLQTAFLSNVYINIIIVLSLIFGLIFNFYNLLKMHNDYRSLVSFDINNSPKIFLKSSSMIKNLPQEMHEIDGRYSFKSSTIEKIL